MLLLILSENSFVDEGYSACVISRHHCICISTCHRVDVDSSPGSWSPLDIIEGKYSPRCILGHLKHTPASHIDIRTSASLSERLKIRTGDMRNAIFLYSGTPPHSVKMLIHATHPANLILLTLSRIICVLPDGRPVKSRKRWEPPDLAWS